MIPAPILAEAREAFRETLNLRGELFTGAQAEAWEEAEAVLSRHWPADAAGLREALEFIAEEHDAGRHDGLPEPCPAHDADTMWATARAALATSAPSDARLREAAGSLDQFAWSSVFTDHPDALANLRTLVGNLHAALSAPAPTPAVRVVRVAVAGDEDYPDNLEVWAITENRTEGDAWREAKRHGYSSRLCIAEIPVPIREVPTVQASVTGAGT